MFTSHKNALKFCNFGSFLFGWLIGFVFSWKNRKDLKNISIKKKNSVHSLVSPFWAALLILILEVYNNYRYAYIYMGTSFLL